MSIVDFKSIYRYVKRVQYKCLIFDSQIVWRTVRVKPVASTSLARHVGDMWRVSGAYCTSASVQLDWNGMTISKCVTGQTRQGVRWRVRSVVCDRTQCLESFYFQRTALRSSTFFFVIISYVLFYVFKLLNINKFRCNLCPSFEFIDFVKKWRCFWFIQVFKIVKKETYFKLYIKLCSSNRMLFINTSLHIFEGGV